MHILLNAIKDGLLPSVILKTKLEMWLNEKKNRETGFQITRDIASSITSQTRFPNRGRVANLNLRNFDYQNVTKTV